MLVAELLDFLLFRSPSPPPSLHLWAQSAASSPSESSSAFPSSLLYSPSSSASSRKTFAQTTCVRKSGETVVDGRGGSVGRGCGANRGQHPPMAMVGVCDVCRGCGVGCGSLAEIMSTAMVLVLALVLVLVVCVALICDGRSHSMRRPSETPDARINRTSPPDPSPSSRPESSPSPGRRGGDGRHRDDIHRRRARAHNQSAARPRAKASPSGVVPHFRPRRSAASSSSTISLLDPLLPPRLRCAV